MKRLFLLGYMGAGKTTFGKMLAKIKGWEFIDLDLFIENRYQKSISRLYEEVGDKKFREIESTLLKEVASFENVVISAGGGTPCFFDNISYMNEQGITIYLKLSPQHLYKRVIKNKDKRPLLKGKEEAELLDFITVSLKEREKFYNQAHIIMSLEEDQQPASKEKTVLDILDRINKSFSENLI